MEKSQGKSSTKAKNKYNAANYDSLRIVVPKGQKAAIEAYVKEHGESINGLVNALLRERLGMTEEEWKQTEQEQSGDA